MKPRRLRETYTDYYIPDSVIDRLKKAGNEAAQKKEGLAICEEITKELKKMKGLRGIHILCGCKGKVAPEIAAVALSVIGTEYAGKISYQNLTRPAAAAAHRQTRRGGLARRLRPMP